LLQNTPSHQALVGEFLLTPGMVKLGMKTAAQDRLWQLRQAAWSVDLRVGIITFRSPKGITATAPVQVVGSFYTGDGTWLWAWADPTLRPAVTLHARGLRDYRQRFEVVSLPTPKFAADKFQCWSFTVQAFELNAAEGAYRGHSGATFIYMTFGAASLSQELAADRSAE
jgi:hypothetical protein